MAKKTPTAILNGRDAMGLFYRAATMSRSLIRSGNEFLIIDSAPEYARWLACTIESAHYRATIVDSMGKVIDYLPTAADRLKCIVLNPILEDSPKGEVLAYVESRFPSIPVWIQSEKPLRIGVTNVFPKLSTEIDVLASLGIDRNAVEKVMADMELAQL